VEAGVRTGLIMSILNIQVENSGTAELRNFGLVTGAIVSRCSACYCHGYLIIPGHCDPGSWPEYLVYGAWFSPPACLQSIATGSNSGMLQAGLIPVLSWESCSILIFFPAEILMRLLGKDPMARKLDSTANSYRITSEPVEKDHIERPY
jgi:hypothetical protein